jgi:signal transduction histidine kinase
MRGVFQAAGEATAVAIGWLVLIAVQSTDASVNYYFNGLTIAIILSSTVYGVRLKIDGQQWHARLLFDALAVVFFWTHLLLFVLPSSALLSPQAWNSIMAQWSPGTTFDLGAVRIILLLMFYASGLVLVCVRVLKHSVRYWHRLRQRYMMWQLATSHLSLVTTILFALVLTLLFNTTSSFSPIENDPQLLRDLLIQSVSVILLAVVFALIALLAVAIPTAVISYIYSSRITEALFALTKATDALRSGDYLARVHVDRQDEIGQLQHNFNQMSAKLLRTRQSLQRERDMVTRLLRSRRELFAGISHELRTPIATLRGYLEATTLRESPRISEDVQHDMQVIYQETMRLQVLVDDMFTLARTEVNRLELDFQSVDVVPMLQRITQHAAPVVWQRHKIDLIADLPANTPLVARVDVVRFEQIMQNLLQHAVFETPPGGIVLVNAAASPDHIQITIKDTAPPFQEAVLQNLWRRFSTTGLGLPLVKELAEAMGGSVSAINLPQQGRCFQVHLPRGEPPQRD